MSRYHLVTLGCPKNEVDSEKLVGQLGADGFRSTDDPEAADLLVVNTCAFIGEARQESIDTILGLADLKADGARLVVTGCMAERYGAELAEALFSPLETGVEVDNTAIAKDLDAGLSPVLDAPLDLILVRKIGVPSQPELAMGALAGTTRILDLALIGQLGISDGDDPQQ